MPIYLALVLLSGISDAPSIIGPTGHSRYFFTLYAGQSVPFKPRTAHTWATFAKIGMNAERSVTAESVTISWLPATGIVKPLRLRSEPGKNFTLEETFAKAAADHAQVSVWGPFEIDAVRYERAVAQAQLLESGAVRYRVFDTPLFNPSLAHCVHAVTHADPVLREALQPVIQVGEPGTSRLASRYIASGAFIGGAVTHDWVLSLIGVDRYPVIHREPGERIPRRWVR